jgi:hypothetical protein
MSGKTQLGVALTKLEANMNPAIYRTRRAARRLDEDIAFFSLLRYKSYGF